MRVKPAIVQAAMTLLNGIMLDDTPAPPVVPTVRSGMPLEWHTGGKVSRGKSTSPLGKAWRKKGSGTVFISWNLIFPR